MNWAILVVVALLAACGAATGKGTNAGPLVTGDSCAVHQEAAPCHADPQGCLTQASPPEPGHAQAAGACLAQGTLERCWPSDQVTNLCVCDNGIR